MAVPATRPSDHIVKERGIKAEDIILMPDTWEYPWFAAWDLALHAVAVATIDPILAENQLLLLFDKRYQSPHGDLPAYEWRFDDTNPPVQAWAAWKIYRANNSKSKAFLKEIFHSKKPLISCALSPKFKKIFLKLSLWIV